uniref:RING-type E3 ubiquitin transferase n=1 Tax=Toxoplasma gondii (strain ATCC 50861 / VEG) TaxID=432359 RepID=A0A0F7UQP1_TOXGV|nr:TPA: ubiquitin-protein ligase [Toxoplasma gondii VEG]
MRTCQEAGDARDLSRSPADDSQTAEERIGEWPNARRRRVESRGTSNWTAVYGTSSSADSVPLCDQMSSGASRSPVVVLSGQPAALAERSPAKNRDPPDVVIVTSDEDVVEEAYCLVSDDEVVITGTSQGGTRAPRSESVAGADRVNSRPLNGQHYRTWRERFSSSLPVQSGAAGEAPTFYPLHIPGRRSDVRSLTEAPSEPVVAGAADGLPRRSTGSRPSDQADARAFLRRTPGRRQQGHAYHHGVEACQAPGLFQQLKEADRCLARARVTVQRLRQAENELFRERRELEQRHNQAVWRSVPRSSGGTNHPLQWRAAELASWEQRLACVRAQAAAARRNAAEAGVNVRRLRRRLWAEEGRRRLHGVGRRDVVSFPTSGASALTQECSRRRTRRETAHEGHSQREVQAVEAYAGSSPSEPPHESHILLGWALLEDAGFSPSVTFSEDKLSEELISRLPCVIYREQDTSCQRTQSAERNSAGRASASAETGRVGDCKEVDVNGSDSNEGGRCAICMDAYREGASLRYLPCFHTYHQACIDVWLSQNGRCPICKENVLSLMELANPVAAGVPVEHVESQGIAVE